MREIKFRGKQDSWLYGGIFVKDKRAFIISEKGGLTYEVDPATVGQYTGLKDKNGKEIYEGDIVRDCFTNDEGDTVCDYCQIFFDEKESAFVYDVSGNQDKSSTQWITEEWSPHGEVVGNIYENPELLKIGIE